MIRGAQHVKLFAYNSHKQGEVKAQTSAYALCQLWGGVG
jgi:hypothetical protein